MKMISKLVMYLVALVLLLITGVPFFMMVMTSFKFSLDFMTTPWSWPENVTLENYILVIQSDFFVYFFNSVIVSVTAVFLVVIFAAMASYPLARIKFRLSKPIYILFLVGMMIPIHTTLIPIFQLSHALGIFDTRIGLIGPNLAFALPISIVIYTQFLKAIPKELEESAKIDGCGHLRLFWNILFPILTPATATVVIYNFIHIWNEFIFALVLTNSPQNRTLPVGMRDFFGEFTVNVPAIMATLTMASVPLLLVYFIAQEKVINGLTAGAVKG